MKVDEKNYFLFLIKFILKYMDFIWELDRITDSLVGTFIEKTDGNRVCREIMAEIGVQI